MDFFEDIALDTLGYEKEEDGDYRWIKIEEAAEYSNIGINKLESLLRSPRCPFVLYVGKKKLVKRKEFEKFIMDNIEI